MSFGQMVELWLAKHLVAFTVGVSVIALIFAAALVKVFVVDRITEARAKRREGTP